MEPASGFGGGASSSCTSSCLSSRVPASLVWNLGLARGPRSPLDAEPPPVERVIPQVRQTSLSPTGVMIDLQRSQNIPGIQNANVGRA